MHTVKPVLSRHPRDLRWCPFVIAVSARYRFVVLKIWEETWFKTH